jgi:divalent metal cation (Fe/Co/Zn/Cd) transporter
MGFITLRTYYHGSDMRSPWILALSLITISLIFMAISVYFIVDNRVLASLLSLAIGVLILGSGLSILREYRSCKQ